MADPPDQPRRGGFDRARHRSLEIDGGGPGGREFRLAKLTYRVAGEVRVAGVAGVVGERVAHRLGQQVIVLDAARAELAQREVLEDAERLGTDRIVGGHELQSTIGGRLLTDELRRVSRKILGRQDPATRRDRVPDRRGDAASVERVRPLAGDPAQSLGQRVLV